MNTSPRTDFERLRTIRERHGRIPPGAWSLAAEGGEIFVLRPGPSFRAGVDGEDERLLTFTAAANTDEMMLITECSADIGFLLGMIDRAIARIRKLEPKPAKGKDFAAEAAMKCTSPAFQRFLAERVGVGVGVSDGNADIAPEKCAAGRLLSLLRIRSRGELNTHSRAAEGWKRLRADFDEWMKRG